MDMPYNTPSGPSPRRELQGPRPPPLRVGKDSRKIRKPPAQRPPAPAAAQPHPPPVIIYRVSPKIIHVNPNEFMSLVQRLTGANSSSTPTGLSQPSSSSAFPEDSSGVSPAAPLASVGKTKLTEGSVDHSRETIEGMEETLLPTPPIVCSSPSDANNSFTFLHDVSPILHSSMNLNYLEDSYMMPGQVINMPSPNNMDIFNTMFDL